MTPYLTVPFKFTPKAWTWLLDFAKSIASDFQRNAPATNALLNLTHEQIEAIKSSPVWPEIVAHSQQYNLTDPWPQLFVYKELPRPRPFSQGNPHIDTYGTDQIAETSCVRFNILVTGEDTTEMSWWRHDRTSSLITISQFQRPDLTWANRLQLDGDTIEQRWEKLGAPDYCTTELTRIQEYASFVRTDLVHALNWTGNQPRVVLSIRYKDAWKVIEQFM
jgi:hypothetical protein